MATIGTLEFEIVDIVEEAPLVRTFRLRPRDGNLSYKAGQFLTFLTTVNGREIRRSYSLSSVPLMDALPAITLKRVANGYFSRRLIDMARVGDVLTATGWATGVFTLPEQVEVYSAAWLFAAGIGITPIYPILRSLLAGGSLRVVLVYSNRSQEEAVFYDALKELEGRYRDRLTIVWLWSNDKDVLLARFSKESFPTIRARHLREVPETVLAYVCGPTDYMWLVQLLLQGAGVPKEAVRREVFQFDKDIPAALPPDRGPHRVTVLMEAGSFTFINAYPQSILASARAAGVVLPYSCEAGQCGSCTAICTSGRIWMSYNEVLTDRDILEGRVLTCTGYAVEGDVTIRL